jgi:hypothetical protein
MIKAIITFVLANYPLTFLVMGLVAAAVGIWRSPEAASGELIAEKLLKWYCFFAIGCYFLYNFTVHVFFGKMSAAFIGWSDSPFQFEVGTASLGFAVVGFMAAFGSFDLRLGAVVGPAMFNFGAAFGHIHQMIVAHNFAPGNAGMMFYMDFVLPLFGFLLLWLNRGSAAHRIRSSA